MLRAIECVIITPMSLKDEIREFARAQGADLVAVAPIEVYSDYLAEIKDRLAETGADLKDYMIQPEDISFFERLSDARRTLPDAKAIIVLGVNAYDETAVYTNTQRELRGKTARIYAYYPVVRQIAEKLTEFIQQHGYKAAQGQHVALKHVADRTRLGTYGKNAILLTKQYGSYVALRNVITDVPLSPDKLEKFVPPCGECNACLKACPTGALYAPYKVNPSLCINPLTRRQDYIPPELRSKMQNWICGCDVCQEVCPVNRKLTVRQIDPRSGFDPHHHASHRYLDNIEKTPHLTDIISEMYPDVIRRNAAIALANIGKGRPEALAALKKHIATASGELKQYYLRAVSALES